MKKKAEMGIGTLIIFIAMIIVAATAAAVLVQTAGSMQQKALETAKESKTAVSTRLDIVHLRGSDGKDNTLENFEADVKLIAGSEPIKLEDLLLSLNLHNASVELLYSNKSCVNVSNSSEDGYYTNLNGGIFSVEYTRTTGGHQKGYLLRGEMAKLCFSSPREIYEDEELEIIFSPKKGMASALRMYVPSVITSQIVKIYP